MKKLLLTALLVLAPHVASASVLTSDTVTLAYNPGVFGPVNIVVGAGNDFNVGAFNYDLNGGVAGNEFTWSATGAGALAGSTSFTLGDLDFSDGSILSGFLVDSTLLTGVSILIGLDSMTVSYTNIGSAGPGTVFSGRFVTNAVPEPTSLALLGLGLAGLGVSRRKKA